jgi:indole-3-glycerol phosphate synthase
MQSHGDHVRPIADGTRDVLAEIVSWKRREVAEAAGRSLPPRTRGVARGWFGETLRRPRADATLRVIAEVKQRSPSRGVLREGLDHVTLARTYEAAGADALSILADEKFFGGGPEIVRRVAGGAAVPVLYKDVVVAPWQIRSAWSTGADAVLLMVRVLDEETRRFREDAEALGLDALVEVHSESEIELALRAGATLVGVNARDLATFDEDVDRCIRLLAHVPAEVVRVGESAVRSAEDAHRLRQAGADAVLIGEALVRAPDVLEALTSILGRAGAPARDVERTREGSS